MKNELNKDKEIFRKTKSSRWSVMLYITYDNDLMTYGRHRRCAQNSKRPYSPETTKRSWFSDDTLNPKGRAICYGCGCNVPDYIQAIIRLYGPKFDFET